MGFLFQKVFFIFSKNYSVKKIIDELINCSINGVDVYRWKDATWLIFTDETRWVVELTDEGTLWYNYRFFKDVFKYVSITVGTEMDGYIIQWANDFFYKDCAHRSAAYPRDKDRGKTSDVIENGIKDTQGRGKNHGDEFEWHTRAVIDNGVKEILQSSRVESNSGVIEEVINKGIKEVKDSNSIHRQMRAENIMGKIIKEVKPNVVFHGINKKSISFVPCNGNTTDINIIVENGVKNIYPDMDPEVYDWSDEFKADNVIQGGIKVIPLPTIKDLRGYSDYYNTKEDKTKPHTEYVKDAIEGGTKL